MERSRTVAPARAAVLAFALVLGVAGGVASAPAASALPAQNAVGCASGEPAAPNVAALSAPAADAPSSAPCPGEQPAHLVVAGEWTLGDVDCAAGRDAEQTRTITTTTSAFVDGTWIVEPPVESVEARPITLSDEEWAEAGCATIELPPVVTVQPVATAAPATCSTPGWYALVEDAAVLWFVDGVETPAGIYSAAPGAAVSVEAAPFLGAFAAGIRIGWDFDFPPAPDCDGAAGGAGAPPEQEEPAPVLPVETTGPAVPPRPAADPASTPSIAEAPSVIAVQAVQPAVVAPIDSETETAASAADELASEVELPTLSLTGAGSGASGPAAAGADGRAAADPSLTQLGLTLLVLAALCSGLVARRAGFR